MRKLILSGMALLFSASLAFAQDDVKMDSNKLPQNVQDFVAQHFEGVAIKSAEKDIMNIGNGEQYEVKLNNGIKLEFDKAGEVIEIDSKRNTEIPEGALPAEIYSYVESNYDNAFIISWEIDKNDQEVELSDGTDLEFDRNGKFLKVD